MTRPLTGRRVFGFFVAGFGIVIAANLVLAVMAVRTFPGVEVANSYVASQSFDADREAQDALGWQVTLAREPSGFRLTIAGPDGRPARVASLAGTLGRSATAAEDRALVFVAAGGVWTAAAEPGPGRWLLRLDAIAADGTRFRQVLDVPKAPEP
jgi:nitrogen fixation protein FixH